LATSQNFSRSELTIVGTSANGEHDVNDGVEQQVDLRLLVATLCTAENRGANLVDAQRDALLKVVGKAIGQGIDVANVVTGAESSDASETVSVVTVETIKDHLSGAAGRAIPSGVAAGGRECALALAGGERVF